MKKTITNLYWNIAPVLPFLFIALLAAGLGWKEVAPNTYHDFRWVLGVPAMIVFVLLPLQLMMPPDFSSWWYRRMVKKNRAQLAERGLTPAQYLDTLPNDIMVRARAKVDFGID